METANIDSRWRTGGLPPEHKQGRRKDGRDLLLEMRRKGYDIAQNKSELENTPAWRAPRLLRSRLVTSRLPTKSNPQDLSPISPEWCAAIQLLQYNRKGYLLVVDCGLPEKLQPKTRENACCEN